MHALLLFFALGLLHAQQNYVTESRSLFCECTAAICGKIASEQLAGIILALSQLLRQKIKFLASHACSGCDVTVLVYCVNWWQGHSNLHTLGIMKERRRQLDTASLC